MIAEDDRGVVLTLVVVCLIDHMPGAVAAGREDAGNREFRSRAEWNLLAVSTLVLEARFIYDSRAKNLSVAYLQCVFGIIRVIAQRRQADTIGTHLPDPGILLVCSLIFVAGGKGIRVRELVIELWASLGTCPRIRYSLLSTFEKNETAAIRSHNCHISNIAPLHVKEE